MTSKIIVNNIGSDSGINTVTFDSNVERGTSNLHSVGLEAAGINVLGADTPIGSGSTIYDDGGARFSGIVTATSFSGDGSSLTGISAGTSLSGSTNNTVCTVTGANAIQGEANLIFTGTRLGLNNTSPTPLNGDGTGMISVAGGNPEVVLVRTTSGTEAKASVRVTDGEDFKIAVKDGSGSTIDALAIDTGTGMMTKPVQPGFEASYPDAYDTSNSPSNFVTQWLRVHHNYGSHFNANNGRFTAPVDGRYLIGTIWTNVSQSNPHCAFGINGGAASGPSRGGTNYTELWHTNAGSGSGLSPVHIFDLSANDYVNVWIYNFTGTPDDPRCYFFGYLLG